MSRTHAPDPALASRNRLVRPISSYTASSARTGVTPLERLVYQETALTVLADTVVLRKELPFAGYSVVKELSILAREATVATSARVELPHQPEPARRIRGGEYRARTGDLLVANQALSQLS